MKEKIICICIKIEVILHERRNINKQKQRVLELLCAKWANILFLIIKWFALLKIRSTTRNRILSPIYVDVKKKKEEKANENVEQGVEC